MLKILSYISVVILLAFISLNFVAKNDFIFECCFFAFTTTIVLGLKYLPELKLHLKTTLSNKRDKNIRVCFSYLIKISIKDNHNDRRYLLVKNNNFDAFQPPGGVYKFLDSLYLQGLNVKEDSKFHQQNDLRLYTKRKNVPRLIKKFNSKIGREVSIEREFHEELIETKILKRKDFPYLDYKYIDTEISDIEFSDHFQCDEIKIFEIFELNLSNDQREIIKSLLSKDSEDFILATEESIVRQFFLKSKDSIEKRITDTSNLLLKPAA